jgi:hypothetical protein
MPNSHCFLHTASTWTAKHMLHAALVMFYILKTLYVVHVGIADGRKLKKHKCEMTS